MKSLFKAPKMKYQHAGYIRLNLNVLKNTNLIST